MQAELDHLTDQGHALVTLSHDQHVMSYVSQLNNRYRTLEGSLKVSLSLTF